MKSTNITSPCVAVLAAMVFLPGFAHGIALTNALYEGFDYTTTDNPADNTNDGDIGANTGGSGWGLTPSQWTSNTSTVLNVAAPGLTYSGLATSGNALNLNALAPVGGTANQNQQFFRLLNQGALLDTGTFYFSYLVRKDADSQRTINFAFFNSTLTSANERFAVGQFSPASTYTNGNFGVTLQNTGPGIVGSTPITFDLGLTYLIVGRVDFNFSGVNDRLTLYINPELNGVEPATPYLQVATVDFGGIDQIRPFVGNATGAQTGPPPVPALPASIGTFDEIKIAPTYQDVTVVPEPGSAALLALAGLGLLGRRRRA